MFISRKLNRQKTDFELINDYIEDNDIDSLEEIFLRYSNFIFLSCQRYLKNEEDSKDAVLEIFEKLPEHLKNHHILNFRNWLQSVARNHCLMKIRQTNRHKNLQLEMQKLYQSFTEVIHITDEKEIMFRRLYQALDELSHPQRTCVEMFYLDSKSYKEISDWTGFDFNQVKSHIQNGRRNLKIILNRGASLKDE